MSEHPTAAELDAFREGELPPNRRRNVLTHLLQGCTTCQAVAGVSFGYTPVDPDAYDAVIGRALRKVRRSLKTEREKAIKTVALLESGTSNTLPTRFRGTSLYQELLDRSWALRHQNPTKMVELARLATIVARSLDRDIPDRKAVADLQCRAWAELGNAYRVAEDLDEAEQAFRRAEDLFKRGSQDDLLLARLLDLRASYYGDRREFDLTFGALDTVYAIHRQHNDDHLAGRTLITKGVYAGYKGDFQEAIRLTRDGLKLLKLNRDQELAFQATHNLVDLLMSHGQLQEARSLLSRNRWHQHQAGGKLNLLKLKWTEAKINADLQRLEQAERQYIEVKNGFVEAGKPYDAAVASLDLATLWLRQGRTTEAKVASLEAYDIFNSLGIRREGTGAFLVLMKAFQVGTATAKLVKSVAEHLRKAQTDPTAKFEPPSE